MTKFDYKEVAKEIGWNFSKINPTVEIKTKFNYWQEVVKSLSPNAKVLDVGCGSAEKTLRYCDIAKSVICIDIEPEMLKKAKMNLEKFYQGKRKDKFKFKLMDGDKKLKFKDNSFDVVISRHCGVNSSEMYRVLKKGGIFISEDVCKYDCQELKDVFKKGQGYFDNEPLYKKTMNEYLDLNFEEVKFFKIEEIEYYKNKDELKYLLYKTPILDGFDDEEDDEILQKFIEDFSTPKGIMLNRRLYGFYLVK